MPLLLRSMGAALLYMPLRWIALVSPAIPRGLREEVFLGGGTIVAITISRRFSQVTGQMRMVRTTS